MVCIGPVIAVLLFRGEWGGGYCGRWRRLAWLAGWLDGLVGEEGSGSVWGCVMWYHSRIYV